jgi:hypothetical protein
VPKQKTNAAIHHTTNASMFTASRTSGDNRTALHLTAAVTKTAMASNTEPILPLNRDEGSGDFQSRKIRAALMGRINSMCVYWSSRRAKANEDIRGRNQIAREITPRIENRKSGDDMEMDSRLDVVGTV